MGRDPQEMVTSLRNPTNRSLWTHELHWPRLLEFPRFLHLLLVPEFWFSKQMPMAPCILGSVQRSTAISHTARNNSSSILVFIAAEIGCLNEVVIFGRASRFWLPRTETIGKATSIGAGVEIGSADVLAGPPWKHEGIGPLVAGSHIPRFPYQQFCTFNSTPQCLHIPFLASSLKSDGTYQNNSTPSRFGCI